MSDINNQPEITAIDLDLVEIEVKPLTGKSAKHYRGKCRLLEQLHSQIEHKATAKELALDNGREYIPEYYLI